MPFWARRLFLFGWRVDIPQMRYILFLQIQGNENSKLYFCAHKTLFARYRGNTSQRPNWITWYYANLNFRYSDILKLYNYANMILWYYAKAIRYMPSWSSGQDVALSRRNLGFDSLWGYHKAQQIPSHWGGICYCLWLAGIYGRTGIGNRVTTQLVCYALWYTSALQGEGSALNGA